jgi:plasmid stability protein
MPDLLVRDIDPELYERIRQRAQAQGKSLAQVAREIFQVLALEGGTLGCG